MQFRETTTQQFEAIRSLMETVIPTLKDVIKTETNNPTTSQVAEMKELKRIAQETKAMNTRIFSMVLNMQRSLPAQVERQQPVHFVDACGFHAPFHLEYINS
jgi:hypothetical protein